MTNCPSTESPMSLWGILKATYKEWSKDRASRLAAAFSYYAIFSIGPLLIIAIYILSLIFGHRAATDQIRPQITNLVGEKAAEFIQSLIKNATYSPSLSLAGIISAILLLYAATNMFVSLQDSLNTVFNVEIREGRGFIGILKDLALTFLMVFVVGIVVIASIGLSAALVFVTRSVTPGNSHVLPLLIDAAKFLSSAIIFTGIFALMFKYLPDIKIDWKDTLIGASITGALFSLARIGLVYYLGRSSTTGPFGAAGSLVIIMLFIYYSSQIFFLGAEFTQVWACRRGKPVRPSENARIIDDSKKPKSEKSGTSKDKSGNESSSDTPPNGRQVGALPPLNTHQTDAQDPLNIGRKAGFRHPNRFDPPIHRHSAKKIAAQAALVSLVAVPALWLYLKNRR